MSEKEIVSPELAEARDQLAVAEAKLAEKRATDRAARALQDAKDALALSNAVFTYGEVGDGIAKIATSAGTVIVKRPTEGRWRQATKDAESRDAARLEESSKNLILDHLVHPTQAEYFALCVRYPAIPSRLIDMIAGLASGGARALSGE